MMSRETLQGLLQLRGYGIVDIIGAGWPAFRCCCSCAQSARFPKALWDKMRLKCDGPGA
jgi:hypothetical protein